MPSHLVDRFTRSFRKFEQGREVEPLIALFADEAELSKPDELTVYGRAGAYLFWREHLSCFEVVRTRFDRVLSCGGAADAPETAVLEWTAEGKLRSGRDFRVQGVIVLDISAERIVRLKFYYDSAALAEGEAWRAA